MLCLHISGRQLQGELGQPGLQRDDLHDLRADLHRPVDGPSLPVRVRQGGAGRAQRTQVRVLSLPRVPVDPLRRTQRAPGLLQDCGPLRVGRRAAMRTIKKLFLLM